MYKNVGRTIKILAKVLFGVGIGISVLIWMVCLFKGASEHNDLSDAFMVVGIATLILGSLASWVNSILLYGFGSLVENSMEIANNTAIVADYTALISGGTYEDADEPQYGSKNTI